MVRIVGPVERFRLFDRVREPGPQVRDGQFHAGRPVAARRSLDSRVMSSRRDFSDRVLSYSFRNAATRLDCSTYADACFLAFAVFDSSCLFLRVASHWMDGARRMVRNDSYRPALFPSRTDPSMLRSTATSPSNRSRFRFMDATASEHSETSWSWRTLNRDSVMTMPMPATAMTSVHAVRTATPFLDMRDGLA